jgi:phosphate starvation-inducible PhoH-like protein
MDRESYEEKIQLPLEDVQNIFGQHDSYIQKIEADLEVVIVDRDGGLKIKGEQSQVEKASKIMKQLAEISRREKNLPEQSVDYALSMSKEENGIAEMETLNDSGFICNTMSGKPIRPKTVGQKKYVDAIREKMIVFGIGPAGTGKTYLAMAMAITAFRKEEVSRIILTRPALEAGEKLGFLPGDLQSKVDPYLRPLYDALHQIMGAESFLKNMEKGLIEVAPLAYMRGRTLDNAYIILDEAQNTTPAQMKMFLTRIGFGSKVVITGDRTQKDLAPGTSSGLDIAMSVLAQIEDIAFITMTSKDVVRHPLVQKIVKAYEDFEAAATQGARRSTKKKRR